jgi:hypothetical protein
MSDERYEIRVLWFYGSGSDGKFIQKLCDDLLSLSCGGDGIFAILW